MKVLKKVFRILVVLLFLLIALAFILPIVFKDDILAGIKNEINDSIDAKVEFEDASLSLFKNFPKVSMSLSDIKIDGKGKFEKIRLLEANEISAHMDFFSIFDSPVVISGIEVNDADLNLVNLSETEANYLITKSNASTSDAGQSEVLMQLDKYTINNSRIRYTDKLTGFSIDLDGVNHQGSGNFTNTIFDLDTKTNARALTVNSDGINYLKKAQVDLDAKINIDTENGIYKLKENKLLINNLELTGNGIIAMTDDNIEIEADLVAEKNRFKDFLSIVPNAFTQDFAKVKADGSTDLNFKVNGIYNADKNKMPKIELDLNVDNAYLKYPDLPKDISNINLKLALKTLDDHAQKLSLNIPAFSMQIGQNPIAGMFKSEGNIENPHLKAYIKGKLDLTELKDAFPLESINTLSGIIDMNATLDAHLTDIQNNRYENIKFAGKSNIKDLKVSAIDIPLVSINESSVSFSPQEINIEKTPINFGKSDATIKANIENPLAYLLSDNQMSGNIEIASKYVDLNEWIDESEKEEVQSTVVIDTSFEEVIKQSEVDYKVSFEKIDYDIYTLKNVNSSGNVQSDRIKIDDFNLNIEDSDLNGNGTLLHPYDWYNGKGVLSGNMELNSNNFDLNPFIEEEGAGTDSSQEVYAAPVIPDDININISTNAKNVKYTNLELKDVNGEIKINENTIYMSDAKATALGGKLDLEGFYNAALGEQANFSMKTNISRFQFKETFEKFISVQKLAPIADYIDGFFNSTLIVSGDLTDDLAPDLSSLSASGFVETLNGVVNGLAPLDKLSKKLNMENVTKNLSFENTKNWFEIKNGVVEIKPFEYKYKDIDMKIAGSHSYNQDMKYAIDASIPRALLKGNNIGALADSGLSFLETEAGKLGLNIDQGDYINLHINIGGNINDPELKIKPVSSGGVSLQDAVKEEVKNNIDEAKEEAIQKVEEKKEEVVDSVKTVVNAAKDSVTKVVTQKKDEIIDSAKTVITETVKDKVTSKIDSSIKDVITKEAAEKILGKDLEEEKDKIKDKLGKFNPFKKKKK